jgi:phosphoglycolate phosphatase-like HAD superfamily hydrolase
MRFGQLAKALWTTGVASTSALAPNTKQSMVAMSASNGHSGSSKPTLRGVIFDMDGTLTIPNLDFVELYRRCGVDQNGDILDAIAKMNQADAARANAIVDEMEAEGRRTMLLMPGTIPVLQWLAHYKIPIALVTRNTKATTERFMELIHEHSGMKLPLFSPIVARDTDPLLPPKPDTAALKYIAHQFQVNLSRELVMVGDSRANDIRFGKEAGVSTALLWQHTNPPEDNGGADIVVQNLAELPKHWYRAFVLSSAEPIKKQPAPQPSTIAGRAALQGDLETLKAVSVQELLAADETGNNPLLWAAEGGHESSVQYILNVGMSNSGDCEGGYSSINHRGFLGATALSRAARHGHVAVLDHLTKHCSNINVPNDKLQYPLHTAAFRRQRACVHKLLKAGADAHAVDGKGRTPLEGTNCPEIQAMLQSAMESS